MKKFFLAFSILLSFSFSWADGERPANPGVDRKEAMSQDGAGTNALGQKGICAECVKHSTNVGRFKNTNPGAAAGSTTTPEPSTSGEVTK